VQSGEAALQPLLQWLWDRATQVHGQWQALVLQVPAARVRQVQLRAVLQGEVVPGMVWGQAPGPVRERKLPVQELLRWEQVRTQTARAPAQLLAK